MKWWLASIGVVLVMSTGCSSGSGLLASGGAPTAAVTAVPTTAVPTTAAPITAAPATAVPTTAAPISAAPTTDPPSSAGPARAPIVVGFAGDTTFTDGLELRDPFGDVAGLLREPDLMVVNLETAVADSGVGRPPVDKAFLFRSPPASLDLLVEAGVDVVALANNHTLDFGVDAMAQTLREIDARSLQRVGAGLDETAAYEPLFVELEGWTIGLVSLSRVPCDWSASGDNVRPQVAWACPSLFDLAETAVSTSVELADVTIVMIHGGEEGVLCPSSFMVDLEQTFASMGVDAVINGHPHVLQGIARYGDVWAAHSLGNFAFPPASGITGNSAIVQLVISEDGIGMQIEPIRSDGGVLSRPSQAERDGIINQMQSVSDGVMIAADGTVAIDPEFVGGC